MDTTGMTEEEKATLWGTQKDVFHKWLVGLTDKELNEIGMAVYAVMDYRVRIAEQLDMINPN